MDHQHYSKKDSYSPFREQQCNSIHIASAEKTHNMLRYNGSISSMAIVI